MLELIMVVVIIGVLAALAVPQYTSFVEKARAAEAINYIGALKNASMAIGPDSSGNYTSDIEGVLGMKSSTQYWSYSCWGYMAPDRSWGYWYGYASRNNSSGYWIQLYYDPNGSSHYWDGYGPGRPQN